MDIINALTYTKPALGPNDFIAEFLAHKPYTDWLPIRLYSGGDHDLPDFQASAAIINGGLETCINHNLVLKSAAAVLKPYSLAYIKCIPFTSIIGGYEEASRPYAHLFDDPKVKWVVTNPHAQYTDALKTAGFEILSFSPRYNDLTPEVEGCVDILLDRLWNGKIDVVKARQILQINCVEIVARRCTYR